MADRSNCGRGSGRQVSRGRNAQETPNNYRNGRSAQGAQGTRISRDALAFENPARSRALIIGVFFALVAVVIVGRLVWLQVIDAQNILDKGDIKREVTVEIQPRRGTIYDRNGVVLATTVDAVNIACHPHMVSAENAEVLANELVNICGGTAEEYKEKIAKDENYVYLYKYATAEQKDAVKALNIEGLDFEDTTQRVYPCGNVASQVLGMLDTDGNALSGLELYYDEILGGTPGKKVTAYSREGVPIPGATKTEVEVVNGRDIVLSLDVELQQQVEDVLAEKMEQIGAGGGSSVVMDADTGQIYAAASMPTFDITTREKIEEGATNIAAFSMVFEPGSIFKPVAMLGALDSGATKPTTSYFCPSRLQVGEYYISDAHKREDTTYTSTEIIAESSNVGMSLVERDMGDETLYNTIQALGVTQSTGVDYPGEGQGSITNYNDWSKIQAYNVAFGQGLMTTPISMVQFYGALANGGTAYTPHFLLEVPGADEQPTFESKQIIENTTALEQLVRMLEEVVAEGTGTAAQLEGYTVAGKTGTAQIASQSGGYKESMYNISFVGFLPGASTNFVCFVGGSDVPAMRPTTEAFHDIMVFATDSYGITQERDSSEGGRAQGNEQGNAQGERQAEHQDEAR